MHRIPPFISKIKLNTFYLYNIIRKGEKTE